jgi:hypothetical protein
MPSRRKSCLRQNTISFCCLVRHRNCCFALVCPENPLSSPNDHQHVSTLCYTHVHYDGNCREAFASDFESLLKMIGCEDKTIKALSAAGVKNIEDLSSFEEDDVTNNCKPKGERPRCPVVIQELGKGIRASRPLDWTSCRRCNRHAPLLCYSSV